MDTQDFLAGNTAYAAWWHLARAYHSLAGRVNRFFEEQGITGAQFGVLRCLADAGSTGLMLSDLSRHLMVTCGNITGVVDRLEQAGYLLRERQPDDRRVIVARLTPAGSALYAKIMPAYQVLVTGLLDLLPVEDQNALSRLCRDLHVGLAQGRDVAPEEAVSRRPCEAAPAASQPE
jgi:DNA-binding MarR family transcriptional regulator